MPAFFRVVRKVDAHRHQHQQSCRRGVAAQLQAAMAYRFVQEVAHDGAEWTRQDERGPEKRSVGNFHPEVCRCDQRQHRAKYDGGTTVANACRVRRPVPQRRAQRLRKHDRDPVEHFGFRRAHGVDGH